MAQGRARFGIGPGQVEGDGDDEGPTQEDEAVGADLRVPDEGPEGTTLQGQVVDGEVDPAGEHEEDPDAVDQGTIPIAKAGVVGGEASGTNRRVGMANGVEEAHARYPEGQGAGDGQSQVDQPQGAYRVGDARGHLFVLGDAGALRPVELHPAHAQQGQHGDRQDDDADATQEVELLAVIQNGGRQLVDATADDGGAGGGEAGDGLEDGVRHPPAQADLEGQGPDHAQDQPEDGDHQEAIAHRELMLLMPVRQPEQGAQPQGKGEGRKVPASPSPWKRAMPREGRKARL